MKRCIGVRFRKFGKIYYFLANIADINVKDMVVCKTNLGIEYGQVIIIKNVLNDIITSKDEQNIILRKATKQDVEKAKKIEKKQKWALNITKNKILYYKLNMNPVDVYYLFDEKKIIFYFTAEKRVDFRALVKDLGRIFRVRVELMQIGSRDEAKIFGGIGLCGMSLCCATFLNDFSIISIKMAKSQNVSLNSGRVSGMCGKLKCCLRYEDDIDNIMEYEDNNIEE